jgi:RNA polymerase sigma-70 factor (ECF subfamily)
MVKHSSVQGTQAVKGAGMSASAARDQLPIQSAGQPSAHCVDPFSSPDLDPASYLSDVELVRALQTGSATAFKIIYERYWKLLLAMAFNRLNDKQASEEAVQDVFLSLWARREEVDIVSLPAYLATAVKFTVLRQLDKERRRQVLLREHYTPSLLQWEETGIYGKFLQEYVEGIVETLPDKCQLVFRYSREGGLSIPEIASKMNLSIKTVETHLTKALKTLRLSIKRSDLWATIFFLLTQGN